MNKTKTIKEIVGTVLRDKGFEYVGNEHGIIWIFGRNCADIRQEVVIQKHTRFDNEYKIMLFSSARGNRMVEIRDVLQEYKDKEYWQAETEDEFIDTLNYFVSFIVNHGFELLENMKTVKPDSFETPERKAFFKQHREELIEKYDSIYHILDGSNPLEQLKHIDDVIFENREATECAEMSEATIDLLLGMAAILSEIALNSNEASINYDSYRVEIVYGEAPYRIEPIYATVQAWLNYHSDGKREVAVVWRMARSSIVYGFGYKNY